MWNPFRKRKPVYFDLDSYDCSSFAREVTEEELYKINGGAQVENSNEGVANAQVGDTITRNDGTTVTLNAGDIKYAQNQLGNNGGGSSGGSATGNIGDVGGGNASASMGTSAPAAGGQSMGNPSGSNAPSSAGVAEAGSSLKDSSLVSSSYQDAMTQSDIQISLPCGGKVQLDINQVNKYVIKGNSAIGKIVDKIVWEREVAKHPDGWAAGTSFDSIEKAAQAWAITYADDSISLNSELSSTIYSYVDKSGRTKYSYNIPKQGTTKNVDPNPELLPGQTAVSVIHSHGSCLASCDDDEPSSEDMEIAGARTEYLVTPFGNLYSYNKDGVIETVRKNLPRDPYADDWRNGGAAYDEFRKNCHPDPYLDHNRNSIEFFHYINWDLLGAENEK